MRRLAFTRVTCGPSASSKTKGPGEQRAAGYCPKILLLKRAKMVLCPFHRSHREICTQNRPVSETKFLDDFLGPLSPGPFVLLLKVELRSGLRELTAFAEH